MMSRILESLFARRRQIGAVICASALIAVVIAAGVWWQSARHASKLKAVENDLTSIGWALGNYVTSYEHMPMARTSEKPGADESVSWRIELASFFSAGPTRRVSDLIGNPGPAGAYGLGITSKSQSTCIYAVVGQGSAFDEEYSFNYSIIPAETILFVSGKPSKEPWSTAGDIDLEQLRNRDEPLRDVIGEAIPGHIAVYFCDGKIWFLDSAIPASLLAKYCQPSIVRQGMTREGYLAKYRIK